MNFGAVVLLALGSCCGPAMAQPRPDMRPSILKAPADWRFEKMPTPPGFARDIQLTGFEEARFAPGMFDNTSPSYFTYVLVISADGLPDLSSAAIEDFLEKYYRGLSIGVGRQKGLSPDPAQMRAEVTPSASDKNRATAKVTFIDSFTDGRKITLHIEARILPRPAAKKTGLLLLISPKPTGDAVWQKLREIGGSVEYTGAE